MMSAGRSREIRDLEHKVTHYATETLDYVKTVEDFIENKHSEWAQKRKEELDQLANISVLLGKLNIGFLDVLKSSNKEQALQDYILGNLLADILWAFMKIKLAELVQQIVMGLKELNPVLEAVEKLALTSVHVFEEHRLHRLYLPSWVNQWQVQEAIKSAKRLQPVLCAFHRDYKLFFSPKLQNVKIMETQLHLYIQAVEEICCSFGKSPITAFYSSCTTETHLDFGEEVCEDQIQKMLSHIDQLEELRNDKDFRMAFLFQHINKSHFIFEFESNQPKMYHCINELQRIAVQLDELHKKGKILRLVNSSVRLGSRMFISGVAVSAASAGASIGLAVTGSGMVVIGKAVTIFRDFKEWRCKRKAIEVFRCFMSDADVLRSSLKSAYHLHLEDPGVEFNKMKQGVKFICDVGSLGEGLYTFAKDVENVLIKPEEFSIGVFSTCTHIYTIVKESIGLAVGTEAEFSQLIRAKCELWCLEMEELQTIYNVLQKDQTKDPAILETPFYPGTEYQYKAAHHSSSVFLAFPFWDTAFSNLPFREDL